jgi:hypothetical protein
MRKQNEEKMGAQTRAEAQRFAGRGGRPTANVTTRGNATA